LFCTIYNTTLAQCKQHCIGLNMYDIGSTMDGFWNGAIGTYMELQLQMYFSGKNKNL
jgi:hypothetical protein